MNPNERDLFKDAKDWQRCIDSGESAQGVAQRTGYSKTQVSLTLNVGQLPTAEKTRYEEKYLAKGITIAAIQELSSIPHPEMRSKVFKRAIEICAAEDKRTETQVR